MAETISIAIALLAAFVVGYGLRWEREKTNRRTLTARAALLEAANARLRDHLRVSTALNEHYLKKQFADDLAARAAAGPGDNFAQTLRSLHVYGASVQTPHTPRVIGGGGA